MTLEPSIWLINEEPTEWRFLKSLNNRFLLKCFQTTDELIRFQTQPGECFPDLLIFDTKINSKINPSEISQLLRQKKMSDVRFFFCIDTDDLKSLYLFSGFLKSDFMLKPGNEEELNLRLDLLLTTSFNSSFSPRSQEILIDPTYSVISYCGKTSEELTKKEFQILYQLKTAGDYGCTREQIIQKVWKNSHVGDKTVDVHLSNLRKKISSTGLVISFDTVEKSYRLLNCEKTVHAFDSAKSNETTTLLVPRLSGSLKALAKQEY